MRRMEKVKALVVDNNPVLLQAISVVLEREGCEVARAGNGLEALNLLKEYRPEIVFTDLVMPLIDGRQLCRTIRNNPELGDVFLVVISGIVLEDMENIQADPCYDLCIAKSHFKEMRVQVREALERLADRRQQLTRQVDRPVTRIPEGAKMSTVARELLSKERQLQRILKNLAEGIVELDAGGAVISINPAATELLTVKEEQCLGCSLADLPWGEHRARVVEWLADQRADRGGQPMEITEEDPLRLGGKVLTASFIPVRDEDPRFGLCIVRNITRQFLAEEQERQLSEAIRLVAKMEAMSSMAGGIAHDFNNLLTVICGNLDMLSHASTTGGEAVQASLIDHARTAAYMAVELTRKISSSSPFGLISRKQLSLGELVRSLVRECAGRQQAELVVELSEPTSQVSVNPHQIRAALENLLENSGEAGSRRVSIRLNDVDIVAPRLDSGQYVPVGSYVCLTVADDGAGIAEENLLKVFDPYYSTKCRGTEKGMGLGLAMVYATIRNHGGYLLIESEKGKGTTVSCYLPRCEGECGSCSGGKGAGCGDNFAPDSTIDDLVKSHQ